MTNLQKYEYKDSGIEWIGKIPKHWETKRIKDVACLYTGNSIPDGEKDYYVSKEQAIPYISTKDINILNNNINYDNGLYIKIKDHYFKKTYKNSILLCIEGANAGKKIAITNQTVCFVNKLCSLQSKNSIFYKFLYYICQSKDFDIQFNFKLNGLIGGVSISDLKGIKFYLPPLAEQQAIADYLDKKCEKIDDILEKTRKQIELLKEYKKSLITEVVTKGLNPKAELKDSGIEWIGKIPKHWKMKKIKYISTIKGRIGFKGYNVSDLVDEDSKGRAIVLGGTNIMRDGSISFDKLTYLSEYKYLESPEIMLKGGEILITKVGAGTGENAIYNFYEDRVTINPNVMLCVLNNKIYSKFVNYFLLSNIFKKSVFLESTKSGAQPAINQEFIKNYKLCFPSQIEQQAIADYLDKKCEKIDKTIETKEQLIEKLEEYKKSLIYECVTGKKQII